MSIKAATCGGSTAFASDYRAAIQGVRGAVTDVLSSVGANAGDSADIAARLAIHKLLAWRLSKIVTTTDPATPMRQMPGATGLKMLHKAFTRAGVPEDRMQAFDRSIATYRQMIEQHAGDASMLEVMLASQLDDPAFADEANNMRKQAFRGAAAVWGAYAHLQVGMTAVSPTHGDDELIDLAYIGGLVDFRPLRESVFWPVAHGSTVSDAGDEIDSGGRTRADTDLVEQFCSKPLPRFEEVQEAGRMIRALEPSIVGNTGMMSWALENINPAIVSRYRDDENHLGQHALAVQTPVELFQYDLLIHRDLLFDPPEVILCGDIASGYTRAGLLPNDRYRLPITERVDSLGSEPPILSSPHLPDATERGAYLCARVGRELEEFTGYRFVMRYPPILAVMYLSHSLMSR